MAVYLHGPVVAPDSSSLTDALSELSAAIPAHINQTRQQLAGLIARSATPVALAAASATSVAGGVVAAAAPVVSEAAMSLVEDKVYQLTSPRAVDPELRTLVSQRIKQEVLNAAHEIEVTDPLHNEPTVMKRVSTPFGERLIPARSEPSSGLLDDAFGGTAEIRREREQISERANRSILPPRIRSLL